MRKLILAALFLFGAATLAAQPPLPVPDPTPAEAVWVDACQVIANGDGSYTIQAIVKAYGVEASYYRVGLNAERYDGPGSYDPVYSVGGTQYNPALSAPYYGGTEAFAFEDTFSENSSVAAFIRANGAAALKPYLMVYEGAPPVFSYSFDGEWVWANIAP